MTTPDPRAARADDDRLSVGLDSPTASRSSEPAPATPDGPGRARRTGRTIGRSLALGLLVFVTVLLVLFVVFNTQTVQISLVFVDVDASLVLALVIAAALGGLLVWLASAVLRTRRRHRS